MARFARTLLLLLALTALPGVWADPAPVTAPAPSEPAPLAPAIDPKAVQGDWVIQRINSDADTLNPITAQSTNGGMIAGQVCEGLLQLNNYTLKLEPCLAESWEISPDQMTYTFHLRHGVKWHDGQPFTSADVKFTYERVQDPKVDCPFLRTYFTNIKSCETPDDYTVRFTASERYFKTLEMIGGLGIVPKHVFEKGEPDFNKHPFGRSPIGTGPYKFVRWDTGSKIVLQRNDDYWDTAHPRYPKRLVYVVIEEPYIAAQLIKKGEIDAFDGVTPIQWEREFKGSRSMQRLRQIVYPYPTYSYIGFNLRLPIFSDVRVRHAIDLLVPRDEIIAQVYPGGFATKVSGYDPIGSLNYNRSVAPTPQDQAQALKLLDEAGWKNDHGDGILYREGKPLTFTLLYPSGDPNRGKIAELTQEALRRAGINLKLERLQFAQLISHLDDWKFDACLLAWSLDLDGDPYQLWHGSQADVHKSSNFIGYKNAEADKLIASGRLEYDQQKRAEIYHRLHQMIHDDYPVCFLVSQKLILIVSDRYQNVNTFAPRPCFDITQWWVPLDLQKYKN